MNCCFDDNDTDFEGRGTLLMLRKATARRARMAKRRTRENHRRRMKHQLHVREPANGVDYSVRLYLKKKYTHFFLVHRITVIDFHENISLKISEASLEISLNLSYISRFSGKVGESQLNETLAIKNKCKNFCSFFVANFASKNSYKRLMIEITIKNFSRFFK